MKKIVAISLLVFLCSSSIFAVKAWEFEVNELGGYTHTSQKSNGMVNKADDILAGTEMSIARCWNDYFGLDFSMLAGIPLSCKNVHNEVVYKNAESLSFGPMSVSFGFALMFPITDQLKIKTTHRYGFITYDRGIKKSVFSGKEHDSNIDSYYFVGYFGSVGITYMPVKNFGVTGGVDYNFAFISDSKQLESGYRYKENNVTFSLRPYIGAVIRLGKKL